MPNAIQSVPYDVVRVAWESKVPIKEALARLDKEVKTSYKQHTYCKYFDKVFDETLVDGWDWKTAWDRLGKYFGELELAYADEFLSLYYDPEKLAPGYSRCDHDHVSSTYRSLYNPEDPNCWLETHRYELIPPPEDYAIVYNNYSQNTLIFPHRLLVLERPDGFASIHYDLPSSQIKIVDEETRSAAYRLDERLDKLCRLVLNVDEENTSTTALSDKTNVPPVNPVSKKANSVTPVLNKTARRGKKASIRSPL